MLRELSQLAKRRQSRINPTSSRGNKNSDDKNNTPSSSTNPSSASNPRLDSTSPSSPSNSSPYLSHSRFYSSSSSARQTNDTPSSSSSSPSNNKQPSSRGLGSLPRRLSRSQVPFQRTGPTSFLSRHRSQQQTNPTSSSSSSAVPQRQQLSSGLASLRRYESNSTSTAASSSATSTNTSSTTSKYSSAQPPFSPITRTSSQQQQQQRTHKPEPTTPVASDVQQTVPKNSPSVVTFASNPLTKSSSNDIDITSTSTSTTETTDTSRRTTGADDDKKNSIPNIPTIPKPTGSGKPGFTAPLVTVDELLNWRPTGAAARCVSTVPLSDAAVRRYIRGGMDRLTTPSLSALPPVLSSRASSGSFKRLQPPRLLMCHDFAGGYPQWEANATGVTGDSCPEDSKLWRFNHWAYVDVFVYFSHYCVTIPPAGFIHAAHRHGALILGTVIFEWEQGAIELGKLLSSFKTRSKAAGQLAAIAKFFGFDGWLLNVEVNLPAGSSAASDLAAFAGDLTRATRKALGPASEVIWYDSVTRKGDLAWQNELNENNEQFFKMSTALFTNYHWDRNAPVRSAVKAGTRRTDVFTGIDVHGRNTFGGGGFHTHIALRAIKQGGTSAAIFAPAWTVEKCPPNVADPRQLEERFWTGPSGRFGRECVAQYFRERPVITDLPFDTNFDPGWGPRLMRNGNVKSDERYFNMAQQQVQPSFMRPVVVGGDPNAAQLCLSHDQAYNGSTSVKVTFLFSESRMLSGTFSILRLMIANVAFAPRIPTSMSIPTTPTNLLSPSGPNSGGGGGGTGPNTPTSNATTDIQSSSSSLRLSSRALSSSPSTSNLTDGSVKVVYHYYAECTSGVDLAANDFGLLLMFGSPAGAVLLVGQHSRWNMNQTQRRALPRLQVSGKFVDMIVVVAGSDRRAFGASSSSSGWMTRTFTLARSLVSAQRLLEVMVIVGGPPEQSLSIRPSPSASQQSSRMGSRIGSRAGSRLPSRNASRSGSPPRNNGPIRRGSIGMGIGMGGENDMQHIPEMEDINMRGIGGAGESSSTPDIFGSSLLNRYRGSVPGTGPGGGLAMNRRRSLTPGLSTGGGGGGSGNNYGPGPGAGGGQLSFEAMQMEEDVSNNASFQMSRFYSRGSSRYSSRLGSLAGSRAASNVVSPSYTPSTGGGGAYPRSALMSPGSRSGFATPSSGRGSEAISELKSALMHAAGSMADGGSGSGKEIGGNMLGGGTGMGVSRVVYLGGLRIEEQNGGNCKAFNVNVIGDTRPGRDQKVVLNAPPIGRAGRGSMGMGIGRNVQQEQGQQQQQEDVQRN